MPKEKDVRGYKAGRSMGESIIEMVHLMYQNRTAAHFLNGLDHAIQKEIGSRKIVKVLAKGKNNG